MGYLTCDKCKGYYELKEGESPGDFANECECGGKLKYVENVDSPEFKNEQISGICPKCKTLNPENAQFCSSCGVSLVKDTKKQPKTPNKSSTKGKASWWNKQSTGGKVAIGVVGFCCLGLILFFALPAMFPDKTTSDVTNTSVTNTSTPQPATTQSKTPTEVTISQLYGTSITEGTFVKVTGTVIESDGFNLRIENSEGQDILVEGLDLKAYEKQTVTVTGTFDGPSTYTTVMGGSRTVPTITGGNIV